MADMELVPKVYGNPRNEISISHWYLGVSVNNDKNKVFSKTKIVCSSV